MEDAQPPARPRARAPGDRHLGRFACSSFRPGRPGSSSPCKRQEEQRGGHEGVAGERTADLLLRRSRRAPVRLRHGRHLRRHPVHQGWLRPVAVHAGRGRGRLAARRDGGCGARRPPVRPAGAPPAHHDRGRHVHTRRAACRSGAERRHPRRRAFRARARGRVRGAGGPALSLRDRAHGDPRRDLVAQPADDRRGHPRRVRRQRHPGLVRRLASDARPRRRPVADPPRGNGVHARDAALSRAHGRGGGGA
jgi:hypothetical protein